MCVVFYGGRTLWYLLAESNICNNACMIPEQSVYSQHTSKSPLWGTNHSFPIKYQKWEMMDGLIGPFHNFLWGRPFFFFFPNLSLHEGFSWSLILFLSLIWNAIILCCSLWEAWPEPHMEVQAEMLLPALNHHSPLPCLHPCLSETRRACLVYLFNFFLTAELSPVISYYPILLQYSTFDFCLAGLLANPFYMYMYCTAVPRGEQRYVYPATCLAKTNQSFYHQMRCHNSHPLASLSAKWGSIEKKKKKGSTSPASPIRANEGNSVEVSGAGAVPLPSWRQPGRAVVSQQRRQRALRASAQLRLRCHGSPGIHSHLAWAGHSLRGYPRTSLKCEVEGKRLQTPSLSAGIQDLCQQLVSALSLRFPVSWGSDRADECFPLDTHRHQK